MNFEEKFVKTMGFALGFVPTYGWILSGAITLADPNLRAEDIMLEAAGSIPNLGPCIGALSYASDMFGETYAPGDIRIQIQTKNPSKAPYLEYYSYYYFVSGRFANIDHIWVR